MSNSIATKEVKCRRCGYVGAAGSYKPSWSVYSDIRCPECNSTNNAHNDEYMKRLQKSMKQARSE